MRLSKIACFLGVTSVFFLAGCSADDGRPVTGPTGPAPSSGTGGGTKTGGQTGTGENRQDQPADQTGTSTSPTEPAAQAAKKANGEGPCTANSDCESGVCFVGGNQSYCSVKCTTDTAVTACVAPFTGTCNKQGFCKRD